MILNMLLNFLMKAVEYFQKASDLGCAMHKLGIYYAEGNEITLKHLNFFKKQPILDI